MKRISLCITLAACALALALAGCAPAPAKVVDDGSLKGFWVLDKSTSLGFDAALNLDNDNLAELMISDSYLEGTWKTDGKEATVTFEDGEEKTAKIYVVDQKLTYGDENGSKLVFVKGSMEEYFAPKNNNSSDAAVANDSSESEEVEEFIDDIEPITITDDETCKIVVTGKGTDFTGDPGYRLSLTNNSGSSVFIVADDTFKVGKTEIAPGMGEVVEPGKTVETFMYFPKDEVGGGVDKLNAVSGKIIVGDDETGTQIATYEVELN